MRIKTLLILTSAALVLSGCGGPGLVSITPDPVTGKMTKKTYTKFYDAGVWLVQGHIGMSVVVDQLDEYSGKITIYAWNRDKRQHEIKIQGISGGYSKPIVDKSVLLAIANERSGLEVGKIGISNYATFIEVDITYELDGVTGKTSLRLERRTSEELEKYFGKNGRPPYPWFHD